MGTQPEAHLEKISRLLRQFGSHKLEMLLVEFTLQVTVHLVVVEGSIFAQRADKLDPAERAGGERDSNRATPALLPRSASGGKLIKQVN